MELIKMITFNVVVIGFVAYITYLAVKSTKHKSKHTHI